MLPSNNMILMGDNGYKTFCQCGTGDCIVDLSPETTIPQYYSKQHARDNGWRYINNQTVVLAGTGWVCPSCAQRFLGGL